MKKKKFLILTVFFVFVYNLFIPNVWAIDYNNLCANNDIRNAMRILGYVIQVIRWIAPMILIVFGMIDFGKASISSEENALKTATQTLTRRTIASVIIFLIPTLIIAILNAIEITNGIELEENEQFGGCTKCLFDPFDSCAVLPEPENDETDNNNENNSDENNNKNNKDENNNNNGDKDYNTVNKNAILIAEEAKKIYNDTSFKKKFKYISPSAKNSDSIRARGYREAVTNATPTDGYYKADCNSFVGIVVKRATGLGGDPNKLLGLGEITVAGPSGGTWVVRNYHKNNFEVVDKKLTLKEALSKAKVGDLLASNGNGSTHIQIYVGDNCVIGNTGGSKVITKKCNDNIPHRKGNFTIIRLK